MVSERSLLERIDNPDEPERRLGANATRMAESIANHLTRMLNVRQGSCEALPDYGMPDFNDLIGQFPDGLNHIRRAIRDSVERYEPRLRRITVKHLRDEDNPLDLRFRVSASMILDDREEQVSFETLVGQSGQVQVRN
jgi:type VI secretion system protein